MQQATTTLKTGGWVQKVGGAILLFAAGLVASSAVASPEADLLLDRWNDEAGLPQGTVTSITRSNDGYLWVGTFGGLHRFSGKQFVEAMGTAEQYAELARVTAVQADGNDIWVGLQGGGLRVYDGFQYRTPDQPEELSNGTVWEIRHDINGDDLFVSTNSGVWRRFANGEWTHISSTGAMTSLEAPDGTIWLGTHSGLFEVNTRTTSTPVYSEPVYGLALDPEGGIWATTLHGPVYLDETRSVHTVSNWEGSMPLGVLPVFDGQGHLWLPQQATMVDFGHWAAVRESVVQGQPVDVKVRVDTGAPRSAYVDDSGTLWVGTVTTGLSRVSTSPYQKLPSPTGTPSFSSGPVTRAGDLIWHAVDCDRLHGFDGDNWVAHTIVPPLREHYTRSHCVRSLAGTSQGLLLVGTEGYLAATDGTSWTPIDFDNTRLEFDETPTAIHTDDHGTLWVGTSAGRLFEANEDLTDPLTEVSTPSDTEAIFSILHEAPGLLVLGTSNGVKARVGDAWQAADCSVGFACGPVRDLARSTDGVVWAATYGGGLGWWTPGAHGRLHRKEQGLPDAFLSSISFSSDHHQMWLHGNRGLHALDMTELHEVRNGGSQRIQAHRVPLGEANGWSRPSQLFEPPSDLWLVTVTGLVHFDIQAMVDQASVGIVDIHGVHTGRASIQPKHERVELALQDGRTLTVRYSTPLLGPNRLARFRYRLRGTDSDPDQVPFSLPTVRTEVSYADIAPGEHYFEVQAIGPEGEVGPTAKLTLSIEAEWYEHPLLASLTMITLMVILGVLALLRLRAVEARNNTLRREVEAQRVVEQRIDEQRQYYRQIFDSAGNAFLLFDAHAHCIDVNREACNLFAADTDGLIGRSPTDLGLDDFGPNARGGHARCKRADGTTFPARVVTATFAISGQRHFLISVIDLSELIEEREARERLRQQLQVARRMEAFGRLAEGVAYDIHKVFANILQHASLLTDDSAPDDESAQEVLKESKQGILLARRMLDLGCSDSEPPSELDPTEVLKQLEELLRKLLPEDVQLVIQTLPVDPILISPVGFEQVILNLVVNAFDAMPEGGRVEVTVKSHNAAVLLTVADQGTGIPDHIRARVFDPFFTTKSAGLGTGLGLATVRDIVKQAGGTLSIDSAVGRGTSVTIQFPTQSTVPPDIGGSKSGTTEKSTRTVGEGLRILIVDDNEHVLRTLQAPLVRAGFDVVSFSEPKRALAWLQTDGTRVDGIISDLVMPGMNGRELIDTIHRSHPSIPVLFMSGYTEEVVLRNTTDGTAEKLLIKPFSTATLLEQVAALLGDKPPATA